MYNHWASVWGNAISIGENRPESYNRNLTFRYPIYSQFGGKAVRLNFDNYCGTEPVTFNRVTVFIDGKFYPITFGGRREVTIGAGKNTVSDELPCEIQPQSLITVSFYFKEFTLLRSAVYTSGPLTEGYYAIGDMTETELIPKEIERGISVIYFLSNVSVLTSADNRTVVCYGDSITAQDWPEYLTLRCNREEKLHTAVIRRAASGTRMLREYNCITYESYGLMGKKRFQHEVPTGRCRHRNYPARNQRHNPPGGHGGESVPSDERHADRRRTGRVHEVLHQRIPAVRLQGLCRDPASYRGLAHLRAFPRGSALAVQRLDTLHRPHRRLHRLRQGSRRPGAPHQNAAEVRQRATTCTPARQDTSRWQISSPARYLFKVAYKERRNKRSSLFVIFSFPDGACRTHAYPRTFAPRLCGQACQRTPPRRSSSSPPTPAALPWTALSCGIQEP